MDVIARTKSGNCRDIGTTHRCSVAAADRQRRRRAETPEQWVELLTRVHGGFGSFLATGIRIGEGAMRRLNAKPRELSVVFHQGEGVPCPCPADGVMLAVGASPGQGTLQVAVEKSPPGTFAAPGRRRTEIHRADL